MATSTPRGSIWLACAFALLVLGLAASDASASAAFAARREVAGGSPLEPGGPEFSPSGFVGEGSVGRGGRAELPALAGAGPFAFLPGAASAPRPADCARGAEAGPIGEVCGAVDLPQAARPPPARAGGA
jgi:hypothetical protein